MNMKNKCDCHVIDLTTGRKRKCKLRTKFTFDKTYCYIHAKQIFTMHVLIIQKYFRRFRVMQKLKKIFYPLPRDLQRKILFYIKEPYLLEKYHYAPISKIVCKKMKTLMSKQSFIFFIRNEISSIQETKILTSFVENLRLFTKYLIIIDADVLRHVNNVLRPFYSRRISRTDENYKLWGDFYNILDDYYKKITEIPSIKKLNLNPIT